MAYGDGGVFLRRGIWYLIYHVAGKRVRMSSGTNDRAEAEWMLRRHLADARVLALHAKPFKNAFWDASVENNLTGAQVIALRRPVVYLWIREGKILYIGKGDSGLHRPLQPNHHRLVDMRPLDEVRLCWCLTAGDACALERKLILKHKPPMNQETARERARRLKTDSPRKPILGPVSRGTL